MTSKIFELDAHRVRPSSAKSIMGAVPNSHLTNEGQPEIGTHGIIGNSPVLKSVLDLISVVAPTNSAVLILGETGTGKELVARAIHELSERRNAPFVTLNCAAIPAGLLESELFGHERGAFTGALSQRIGRFEAANGGTLFLDELGDMPLDLQAKLLRVLQEKEFERLGSTRSSRVNVRVVAATNRDLLQMIDDKSFRADLYYRLSVFPILLPPLRDRPEDIPALVRHFVAMYAWRMNKAVEAISPETMEAMVRCDWPGNIRELQNFIERGIIISRSPVFRPDLDQIQHQRAKLERTNLAHGKNTLKRTLDESTRNHIVQTLDEVKWVIGGQHGAATRLGIPRTTLIYKMRRLGIDCRHGATRAKGAASSQSVGALSQSTG
ncbi:MAG TPA: sigma 54-interacting transcriptional regulator [Bryobacteraceae bacterium]|nr:sigma 54-interacting transcriptional regulator [Bryobacteraceae bacterium]